MYSFLKLSKGRNLIFIGIASQVCDATNANPCQAIIIYRKWSVQVLISGIPGLIINYGQPKLVELNHGARGISFFRYCILCTRAPIFNFKIFSNCKISNSVKYGVGLSLLFAKKMPRIQLF